MTIKQAEAINIREKTISRDTRPQNRSYEHYITGNQTIHYYLVSLSTSVSMITTAKGHF